MRGVDNLLLFTVMYLYMGKTTIIFLVLVVFVFAIIPSSVLGASTSNTSANTALQNLQDRIEQHKEKREELMMKAKERASVSAQRRLAKLNQTRLRVCEARKNGITQRATFMLTHGGKINTGHMKIQERVNEYYNNHLVPEGYVLPNYQELIDDMAAAKANVLTVLDLAKESGANFDCSGDDPKGKLDAFKEDMKELIAANKAYRQSVHNFVKAVLELARQAKADQSGDQGEDDQTTTDEGGVQ